MKYTYLIIAFMTIFNINHSAIAFSKDPTELKDITNDVKNVVTKKFGQNLSKFLSKSSTNITAKYKRFCEKGSICKDIL
jgi:hypothetical protein